MSRRSNRSLQHRIWGQEAATAIVLRVAGQWQQGMPLGLARKILRKQGIHAWSLLVPVEGAPWANLIQLLDVPRWAIDACLYTSDFMEKGEMVFHQLPKGASLPEGLVIPKLVISNSLHIRRLPDRTRVNTIEISECAALESIPAFRCRPWAMFLFGCHQLKTIPAKGGPNNSLVMGNCKGFMELATIPVHGPGLSNVTLRNLPQLKRISKRGAINALHVRSCPSLESLQAVTVDRELLVHRCLALRTLPRFRGQIRGHVTDCPGLVGTDLAEALPEKGSTLKVQPFRGSYSLPPVQAVPSTQPVAISPLLPSSAFEDGPAWPWPPFPRMPIDSAFDSALEAFGLPRLDRMKCQVGADFPLSEVIHRWLSNTANPGVALDHLQEMIDAAMSETEGRAFEVLLHQAERFGIGLVSVWLALSGDRRRAMTARLPISWSGALADAYCLEGVSEALDGIPGSLVIARQNCCVGPGLGPGLGPKAITGPLWARGNLTIDDCLELDLLPDLMVVKGNLRIANCPSLSNFPKRLEVDGDLTVENLPRLERSVCRVAVGGETTVRNTPSLQLVTPGSWEE